LDEMLGIEAEIERERRKGAGDEELEDGMDIDQCQSGPAASTIQGGTMASVSSEQGAGMLPSQNQATQIAFMQQFLIADCPTIV